MKKVCIYIIGSREHVSSTQYAVQATWKAVQDLLQPRHTADVRHAVLQFLQAIVAGQYSELGVMRAHFFQVIQSHHLQEDAQQRSASVGCELCGVWGVGGGV